MVKRTDCFNSPLVEISPRGINRRYAHFITRTENDQLSVDGAKLNGNLTERSVWQARWPVLSSSGELLLEPHLLPILLYGTSAFAPSTLN